MTITLELVHPTIAAENATVTWDEEAGELTGGAAADLIRRRAATAARRTYVIAPPHPTAYDIGREPLKSRRDLALIISTWWLVPEPLVDALPAPPDEGPTDVEVVY
jgi:hypothetical protein